MPDLAHETGPPTYGWLVEHARRAAAHAAAAPPPEAPELQGLGHDAAGLTLLVTVAARHARFLARGVSRNQPAHLLASHLDTAHRALATMKRADGEAAVSLWHGPADLLAVAHDLLTTRRGPVGEPRSPDARVLTDENVIATATGRLAAILVIASVAAEKRVAAATATAGRDSSYQARLVATAVWPLRLVASLTEPATVVTDLCHAAGRRSVLDSLGPLFGDPTAEPLDRQLHQLHRAADILAQPGHQPSHHTLAAVAGLIATTATYAGHVAARAARHATPDQRPAFLRAAAHATQTRHAWEPIRATLHHYCSLGTDGRIITHLSDRIRQHLDAALPTADAQAPAVQADAIDILRRTLLILPNLAIASASTTNQLAENHLLTRQARNGTYALVPPAEIHALLTAYDTATQATRVGRGAGVGAVIFAIVDGFQRQVSESGNVTYFDEQLEVDPECRAPGAISRHIADPMPSHRHSAISPYAGDTRPTNRPAAHIPEGIAMRIAAAESDSALGYPQQDSRS